MKKLTAEWVQKAEEDYQVAVQTHHSGGRFHNAVCFHCQQASEKFLKALMEEAGLSVPKTHDLDDLRTKILPYYSPLPVRRGLVFMKRFAVETRYPSDRPAAVKRSPLYVGPGSCELWLVRFLASSKVKST